MLLVFSRRKLFHRGLAALEALREQGASCCVAFLHAGEEKTNRAEPDTVRMMDALGAAGFDVVTACHSHRISGWREGRRPDGSRWACLYGLGSLASSVSYSDLEREGVVVVLGL